MSVEKRIEKLEEKVGVSPGEPRFIVHTLVERNEDGVETHSAHSFSS